MRLIACHRENPMAQSSVWNTIAGWLQAKPKRASAAQQTPDGSSSTPSTGAVPFSTRELRAQRREQLFALVREHMIRAGVLSGAYKFKALTLDKTGNHFLVLMDIQTDSVPHDPAHLSGLEAALQKAAKDLLQIEVKYVYWRLLGTTTDKRQPPHNEFAATQPLAHDDADGPNLSETQYAQFR